MSNLERHLGDAPLAMEPVAGPVLPWPGMSETAGAPSSSPGVEVPRPMAVEPDPMVRRGLKRASDCDPEISEMCSWISDVSVNEEPPPQVPVGEFTDVEEWQALSAEFARLDEFDAKKDIPRDQATGPLLTFTWVRTVKNGAPNYRLCLVPLWSTIRKEQGVFVLSDTWTTDLQNVACSGCPSRLECEVFRCEQGVPAHTHQNSSVCCSTRRISESDSWWCLGSDQNCVWLGGDTR